MDLLAIQKEIHPGLFAVMDGTTAGNGPGPRTMIPVQKNVLLAAADQVAIDAVAAKLMGFDPMSIRYMALAHERGLGVADPRDIEIVGDAEIASESWGFTVGDNFASRVGDLLWFGPLKRLQKLFFHTPLVYLFVAGSYLYHDYVWYPVFGRRRVREFVRTSPWGALFARYLGMSPLPTRRMSDPELAPTSSPFPVPGQVGACGRCSLFALARAAVRPDWDGGSNFHPDERRIAEAVTGMSFRPLQLNPHFFAYGSLAALRHPRHLLACSARSTPGWPATTAPSGSGAGSRRCGASPPCGCCSCSAAGCSASGKGCWPAGLLAICVLPCRTRTSPPTTSP